jgi:hypothetical protein
MHVTEVILRIWVLSDDVVRFLTVLRSADEMRGLGAGSRYKLQAPGGPEGVPGLTVAYIFGILGRAVESVHKSSDSDSFIKAQYILITVNL